MSGLTVPAGGGATNAKGSPLARLLRYFVRYRGRALAALLAMAIVSVATVVLLFLLNKVIDDALGAGSAASIAGVKGASPRTVAPLLRLLEDGYALAVAAAAGGDPRALHGAPAASAGAARQERPLVLFGVRANGIGLGMVRDLRHDAYEKLIHQSSRYYTRAHRPGS